MTKHSEAGKGSSPRPYSVSQEEYSKRWDAIFQRDLDEPHIDEEEQYTPDDEEDEETLYCVRCGGIDTMYKAPNGMHLICDQCGYAERVLSSEGY